MQETEGSAQRLEIPVATSLQDMIRTEQLRLAYNHLPLALLATMINSSVLVAILWNRLGHSFLLIWLSAILLLTTARYALTIGYRNHATMEMTPSWEHRFTFSTIAAGVLWGCIPIFLFPANSFPDQAMIIIVLVGMSAGACVTLSSHRKLLQAYLILLLIPMIIRVAMEGNDLALALAFMGSFFLTMVSVAAKMFSQRAMSNIRLGLEAQKRELDLQQTEDQYRYLFDMASDGIFIVDMEGNFINANRVAHERLGYQRQELLDMNIAQILSPRFASGVQSRGKEIQARGSMSFEAEHVRKDGSIMLVEVNAQTIDHRGQKAVLSIVRDITERKQTENKLRTLSRALEQAGESVIITDRNGLIEYVNPAFTAITGYTIEDVIGKSPPFLIFDEQDMHLYRNMWKTLLNSKAWQKKMVQRHKDGSKITVITTISPIINEAGITTNYVGIQQDITDQEILEERLNQAQKMEAIGTLVGGIAHDFNNMLAGITGNLFLAKQKIRHLPLVVEKLETSEKLAFSASKTIQQLLTFARKGKVEISPLDLGEFFRETSQLYEISIPKNIAYTNSFCDQKLVALGEETQLQQAIINLLNNARDAVASVNAPQIALELEAFEAPPRFLRKHNVSHKHFAHISVKDNGCGISARVMERIFEPFFTTKEVGRGSGLGLAMIYGTIIAFNGLIEVDSAPGAGTTFHIYLPAQTEEQYHPTEQEDEEPVHGQGEILLVVDDNPQVRETTCLTLESLGYQVRTASDGMEAIETFSGNPEEIRLVIMDLVMPKLGGVQAYNRMREIEPDVCVVFVTGHDMNQGLENEIPQEKIRVLHKPYTTIRLSHTLREMLELNMEST